MTVTGRRNGRDERFATEAMFGAENAASDYIQQLWAARKVGALSRELRLHGSNPEIVAELKRLALRYGILTEFTSYLVQEPNQVVVRGMLDRVAAPAPEAQLGAGAVARSERERKLSGAVALEAVVVTAADSLSASRGDEVRRVGGRAFVRRNGVWTDLAHGDSLTIVAVAPFSDAYFALLRALPELVKPATLEPAVLVAGRRVSIKIEAGGRTAWGDGELARIVREFRG